MVAQICGRLDGIPLAIELAAARVRSLPVETIAARLDKSIELLAGGPRDVLPRHQTLRAALDWSWVLLGGQERALLRQLAVFVGGCQAGAVAAVCGGDGGGPWAVPELLDGLVNKSLVALEESAEESRYILLETVRQYAAERLAEAGEEASARDRHLAWYVTLAEAIDPQLTGPHQGSALERLENAYGNLRAALGWARESGHGEQWLRLAASLWRFWYMRGYLSEGRNWLEGALAVTGAVPAAQRAHALNGAGSLAVLQGEYGQAMALFQHALALRRSQGDPHGIAASLTNLGVVADRRGEYERAATLFEEALALARELGDTLNVAKTLGNLGAALGHQGAYGREEALYREALVLFRELGDTQSIAIALDNLGAVAERQGDYEQAGALYEEALSLFRALGDRHGAARLAHQLAALAERLYAYGRATDLVGESLMLSRDIGAREQTADNLEILVLVAAALGQHERGTLFAGAVESLRDALAAPLRPDQRVRHEQAVRAMRAALGTAAFAAAWEEGSAMPVEQAVTLALLGLRNTA